MVVDTGVKVSQFAVLQTLQHLLQYFYRDPVAYRVWSIVISMSVCLSAWISQDYTAEFHKHFYARCTRGRASVLLCQRFNILRASGFADDVTSSHNRPYGGVTHTAAASMQ